MIQEISTIYKYETSYVRHMLHDRRYSEWEPLISRHFRQREITEWQTFTNVSSGMSALSGSVLCLNSLDAAGFVLCA
jgi:hypothetical protein